MLKKIVALLVLGAFLFGSPAQAQEAPEWEISRTLTIPAAAFRPNQDGFTYTNFGYQLEHSSFSGILGWYIAPLHLPHGAIITSLTAYIEDFIDGEYGAVHLFEISLTTGSLSAVASVTSPMGTNSTFTGYSIGGTSHVVDNQNCAYYLQYRTPMEQTGDQRIRLGAVQVGYRDAAPTASSFYSLSTADFTPSTQAVDYIHYYEALITNGASPSDFLAGLSLPNGARIEQMTFYYIGAEGITATASLARSNSTASSTNLGSVTSVPVSGVNFGSTTTFTPNSVDNTQYTYYVLLRMPGGPALRGLTVLYTRRVYSTDESWFSIPAASFVPKSGGYTYENLGSRITHTSGADVLGMYVAPFTPPSGVSVTQLTFMVGRTTGRYGDLRLLRQADTLAWDEMGHSETPAGAGWITPSTTAIAFNPIDTLHNVYYLSIELDPSTISSWVRSVGARGQLQYRSYLPLARKK